MVNGSAPNSPTRNLGAPLTLGATLVCVGTQESIDTDSILAKLMLKTRRLEMSIDGTKYLGNWGKMIPVNDNSHITQTNVDSCDGLGFHATINIPGTQFKVHDKFDANGEFIGSYFSKR